MQGGGGEDDPGVQLTTMRRASDVFDRGSVVAHEGYLGLELVQAHVQTSISAAKKAKFAITHKTRVWFH